jgi:hypothetical protein
MPGDQNLNLETELGRQLSSSASLYERSPISEQRAEPVHPSTLRRNSSNVADPSYTLPTTLSLMCFSRLAFVS